MTHASRYTFPCQIRVPELLVRVSRLCDVGDRPAREAPLAISDIYLMLDVSASDVRDHWE